MYGTCFVAGIPVRGNSCKEGLFGEIVESSEENAELDVSTFIYRESLPKEIPNNTKETASTEEVTQEKSDNLSNEEEEEVATGGTPDVTRSFPSIDFSWFTESSPYGVVIRPDDTFLITELKQQDGMVALNKNIAHYHQFISLFLPSSNLDSQITFWRAHRYKSLFHYISCKLKIILEQIAFHYYHGIFKVGETLQIIHKNPRFCTTVINNKKKALHEVYSRIMDLFLIKHDAYQIIPYVEKRSIKFENLFKSLQTMCLYCLKETKKLVCLVYECGIAHLKRYYLYNLKVLLHVNIWDKTPFNIEDPCDLLDYLWIKDKMGRLMIIVQKVISEIDLENSELARHKLEKAKNDIHKQDTAFHVMIPFLIGAETLIKNVLLESKDLCEKIHTRYFIEKPPEEPKPLKFHYA